MHSRKFAVIAADMTSRNLVHESICNCCTCKVAGEMNARTTYDNILRLSDDPDVNDAIRFLREREIVHYQRFGELLRRVQDQLNSKNFYAINPSFDKKKR